MEKIQLDKLFPLTPSSTFSTKKGRSGYEPSDTETEWQDTPRFERGRKNMTLSPEETKDMSVRNKSPMTLHKRRPSRFEFEVPSSPSVTGSVLSQPRRRHHSKSPYRPHIAHDDGNNDDDDDSLSYIRGLNSRRNTSPLPRPDFGRTVSPYNRTHEQRAPSNENRKPSSGLLETDRANTKPNYRRAVTAPRLRDQEQARIVKQREKSPFKTGPVRDREINEMIAQVKLSKNPTDDYSSALESTDSIQTGDLFFSRECNALQAKNSSLPKKGQQYGYFSPRPEITNINPISNPSEIRGNLNMNMPRNSSGNALLSRTTRVTSIRKGSGTGTGKTHVNPSVKSDASAKTTDSMRKFTSNRKKNQKDAWFACMMRTGNCKISRKSPERKPIDEASLIERAIIVESLPQFWADKHQPASLNGFICNKQEAQLLKELVSSHGSCPHILLKGPSNSEKRELAMALLREIYGDACSNLSHDLRHFPVQDKRTMKVSVPITSSSHHMELNVNSEPNAKYALMGLIKEISNIYAITHEVSNMNFKSDNKVIILYEVDKAVENIQHLIKWIIDRYSDICRLVLCCEDDENIIAPVKNRFKVINVDAPQTHEIIEVLTQIANKEDIDLSMNFAMKIATKSKQNLREAVLALEACRAHNYPFSEEQPIPVGWEKIVIEVSVEILTDPSFSRLLSIRGKFQMLLLDFVHPRLILLKLVEQLLRRTEAGLKRELYYWHAYYDRKLPPGTTALLKLEEFVAKFMSICRRSSVSTQYV